MIYRILDAETSCRIKNIRKRVSCVWLKTLLYIRVWHQRGCFIESCGTFYVNQKSKENLSDLFRTTLIKIPVIWHVMSCQLLNSYWSLHDCCTLMMEAIRPFETPVTIYRRHDVTSQNTCNVVTSQWKLQISQN